MIYISGPMSGVDNYVRDFAIAESQIIDLGLLRTYDNIINPSDVLTVLPDKLEYKDLMRICLDLLAMCNAVYMLRGWEDSKGARLEHEYAVAHKYKIYYQK